MDDKSSAVGSGAADAVTNGADVSRARVSGADARVAAVSGVEANGADGAAVMFLFVERGVAELVSYPDGGQGIFAVGAGQAAADVWNAEHRDALLELDRQRFDREEAERRTVWEAEIAAHRDRVATPTPGAPTMRQLEDALAEANEAWQVRRVRETPRDLVERLKWDRENPAPDLASVCRERFGIALPEEATIPGPDPFVAGTPPAQAVGADVHVVDGFWWAHTEQGLDVGAVPLGASEKLPHGAVAVVLDEYRRTGWRIVHVSDDRQVVHEFATSRSERIGLSFLLER